MIDHLPPNGFHSWLEFILAVIFGLLLGGACFLLLLATLAYAFPP